MNSVAHLVWKIGRYRYAVIVVLAVFAFLVLGGAVSFGWAALAVGVIIASMGVLPSGGDDPDPFGDRSLRLGGLQQQVTKGRRQRQESWRMLVDAMPQAAIVLDAATRVLHYNAAVSEVLPRIKTGQPLTQLSRNPELNAAADKVMQTGEPATVTLFERVPVERNIEVVCARLQSFGGKRDQPCLLLTFRDLTEQDRLTQMRADFIANASHELRTPLASLRGFVETLQGAARDDPNARDKFLGLMASQAARMTRLIDDLLSLSRVEMRVHVPPKGTVDLNDVAKFVAQALEPLAEGAKMRVLVHVLEDGRARIRGDREEIVQVLQNLVHNAIKYGQEDGAVTITVGRGIADHPGQERVSVSVSDDGPGISSSDLPRLTERFYRTSSATRQEKGGTGLGLAIVKHIVLRHRGDLEIESKIGEGSTFRVTFESLG